MSSIYSYDVCDFGQWPIASYMYNMDLFQKHRNVRMNAFQDFRAYRKRFNHGLDVHFGVHVRAEFTFNCIFVH